MFRKIIYVRNFKVISDTYLLSFMNEYNYIMSSIDGRHLHTQLQDCLSSCNLAMGFVVMYQDKDIPMWFKSIVESSIRLSRCFNKSCGSFMIPFVVIAVRSSLSANPSRLTFDPHTHYSVKLDSHLTRLFLPLMLYNSMLLTDPPSFVS